MTAQLYLECFAVASIGHGIHVGLKIRSLKEKARIANTEFRTSQYFKEDRLSIVITFLFVIMCLFFIADILMVKPTIINYLKFIFAFIGYSGSDFVTRIFGAASKKIDRIIDEKTNIADSVTNTPKLP